ncbi:MAG: hypothetical protein IKE23_01650, partial [Exiguobacterium sp.]|nr:hypothetical protein [Exiguobacterium sp.]
MAVKTNTTLMANYATVNPREIDFVTRFERNWRALMDIMGISRPIKKVNGTKLVSRVASVTLQSGAVAEGDEIPYSQATVTETPYADITIEKYAKAVSIESIAKYGYDVAIEKTDDEFLNELQSTVLSKFYTYIQTGTLTDNTMATFQEALAKAKGAVLNAFSNMNRTCTEVVGFVNVEDAYEYLGTASISVQTQSGLTYLENFMGYRTVFLCGSNQIPSGTVIAIPRENLDLYYIDPSDSDFARAGLQFTTDGVTNLLGFHTEGKYSHAVS